MHSYIMLMEIVLSLATQRHALSNFKLPKHANFHMLQTFATFMDGSASVK